MVKEALCQSIYIYVSTDLYFQADIYMSTSTSISTSTYISITIQISVPLHLSICLSIYHTNSSACRSNVSHQAQSHKDILLQSQLKNSNLLLPVEHWKKYQCITANLEDINQAFKTLGSRLGSYVYENTKAKILLIYIVASSITE